jgi:hypothetical protein
MALLFKWGPGDVHKIITFKNIRVEHLSIFVIVGFLYPNDSF